MFNKHNLKHVLILALGFFSCSYIYLIEGILIKNSTSANYANLVSVLYGSFAMAIGLLLFIILYKKTSKIKICYLISMILNIASVVLFLTTKSKNLMSICLILSCIFGVGGFAAGYHFSLVASSIEKEYQGRIFTIGYGLGSVLTYIVSLFPKYAFNSTFALIVSSIAILITTILVFNVKNLELQTKEKFTQNIKGHILTLIIIVISMATISAVSQCMIGLYTLKDGNSNWFADTRIYYTIGLIISGIIYDKKKEVFDIILPISFIYPLVSIVLLKQEIPLLVVSGLSYFFLGFFSTFRALAFIRLGNENKNLIFVSVVGLMIERLSEGTFVIIEDKLFDNYILLLSIEAILLSISLSLYLVFLIRCNKESVDKIKLISLKAGLSIQEEKVLRLIVQDKTNQEMADELYVSVNTIRNHIASIYKKTGMKKNELRKKYYYGSK